MEYFIRHRLANEKEGVCLILYLDPMTAEFGSELENSGSAEEPEGLEKSAAQYIRDKLPGVKINTVKIVAGSILLATLTLTGITNTNASALTADAQVQQAAQPISIIINGTPIVLSHPAVIKDGTAYVPARDIAEALGAAVWWNETSKTVGINKGDIKIAFVVGATVARVNDRQISMQPSFVANGTTMVPLRFIGEALGLAVNWNEVTRTISISPPTYTVQSGDTLWKIATKYALTVDQLKRLNQLNSDTIYAGQKLSIAAPAPSPASPAGNTVTYTSYTIQSGDNMWSLSIKFGVPMTELLRVNNMTTSSALSIGQKITVPVHHIAVQQTVSARHGEYLDWWTEAQYVFPINKVATVRDFKTGKTFKVKRTTGANHADSEPLTAADAAIIREVWGGAYSWQERAVIIEVDGRRIAASMASMPHDVEYIKDNNFAGHFDIHFKNSTRHKDGLVSEAHQAQVRIAAGIALV